MVNIQKQLEATVGISARGLLYLAGARSGKAIVENPADRPSRSDEFFLHALERLSAQGWGYFSVTVVDPRERHVFRGSRRECDCLELWFLEETRESSFCRMDCGPRRSAPRAKPPLRRDRLQGAGTRSVRTRSAAHSLRVTGPKAPCPERDCERIASTLHFTRAVEAPPLSHWSKFEPDLPSRTEVIAVGPMFRQLPIDDPK